ncbi:MAG: hypothetical protein K0S53_3012 [Bacteroidetes bacterium]|jgi:antitoxin component YwqK of YwqJK toxin-antitoxin module|nr:hypothetical protein [Bacteroidota bacterium]MDF2451672.1 hypothetical protein [Bacteroidota bacterium]
MKKTIILYIMLIAITASAQTRVARYPNGKLKAEISYKDSLKHGIGNYYFENGKPQLVVEYENDKLVGTIKQFYESGRHFMIIDAKTLNAKVYSEDSISYYKGRFENLKFNMNGIWEDWIVNPHYKKYVWTFVNGYKTGPYTAFRQNGSVEATGHYLNGTLTDTLKMFDEKGILQAIQIWKIKNGGKESDLVRTIHLTAKKPDGTPEVIDGKIYIWRNGKKEFQKNVGE